MNKRVISAVILLVALLGLIFSFAPDAVPPVKVGEQVRAFALPNLEGEVQGIPQGEVVILNFWATWCPPCREEIPSMVALYAMFKEQGLKIVAVAEDKTKDVVVEFVQEQGMEFTVLHETDAKVARQYGVFRYPETLIIDRNGVVRQYLKGAVTWTDAKFTSYIEQLLAEPVVAK